MTSTRRLTFTAVLVLVAAAACRPSESDRLEFLASPEVKQREARFMSELERRRSGVDDGSAFARWLLPETLNEISGLTLSKDGRLFAHGDEKGVIAVLDYKSGVVIKEFRVGKFSDPVDFEGITMVNDTLILIVSNGDLYEFREGGAGERVEYAMHKMGLEKECEFEGVAWDPAISSLLLACKNVKNDVLKDSLVIFRWKPGEMANNVPVVTKLAIAASAISATIEEKNIHPSDIAVDPATGNYVLISSQERAIFEITPTGQVVYVRKLSDTHEQPEGLAITKDSLIVIGDEAARARAVLTVYRKGS
jgi:uncharacterized protein YjiK